MQLIQTYDTVQDIHISMIYFGIFTVENWTILQPFHAQQLVESLDHGLDCVFHHSCMLHLYARPRTMTYMSNITFPRASCDIFINHQ